MPKTGMAPAAMGKPRKVKKSIQVAEEKARARIASEKRQRDEKRAYWKKVNEEAERVEESRKEWIAQLQSDLTDDSLAPWCIFGHEGFRCKFKAGECTHYHGGCRWNKEGYICVAHTRGECSMQHCKNQEKLPYKYSERIYNEEDDSSGGGVVQKEEFEFKAEDFAALSM